MFSHVVCIFIYNIFEIFRHGRIGEPHLRLFKLSEDNLRVVWQSGGLLGGESSGTLKRVMWYFEEVVWFFEEVVWYFEEGGVVS